MRVPENTRLKIDRDMHRYIRHYNLWDCLSESESDKSSSEWNVGVIKKDNHIAGFVGQSTKKSLIDGLIFGVQDVEKGTVVYLADNPLFRSFWESGKMLFSNAVFMVGH